MTLRIAFLALAVIGTTGAVSAQQTDSATLRGNAVAEASLAIEHYMTMLRTRDLGPLVDGVASAARAEVLLNSYIESDPDAADLEEFTDLAGSMAALSSHVPRDVVTAPNPFATDLAGPLTLFLRIVQANLPSAE